MPHFTANGAMKRLMDGNSRFISGKSQHPNATPERRTELACGQDPFAIVVTCSDSRVPPELIFDTGLGDLFVVRVAGNVINDIVEGSVQYAVEHLGIPLCLVLGHTSCGAISASLEGECSEGGIASIIECIKPSIDATCSGDDQVHYAMIENVRRMAVKLRNSEPVLSRMESDGRFRVVEAYYDVKTGKVIFL